MTDTSDNPGSNSSLDNQSLSALLKAQLIKAENETKELELRAKDQDNQAAYARRFLELQAELYKNSPLEHRKTLRTWAYIFAAIITLFLTFALICLYLQQGGFVIDLIEVAGYPASVIAGYYFGRKKNEKRQDKNTEPIQPYEEVS